MVILPPLGENEFIKKKEVKLPEVDSFDPNVRKEKLLKHFEEIPGFIEGASNEAVEKTFRTILSLAIGVSQLETEEDYEEELKKRGLYDIDLLEKAIETGELSLERFNLIIFTKVIQKLEKKKAEEFTPKKPTLNSYGAKNQDEFYDLIVNGKIDLDIYSNEEIDSFTKQLKGE